MTDSILDAWPRADLLNLARELGHKPAPSIPKAKLIALIDPPKVPDRVICGLCGEEATPEGDCTNPFCSGWRFGADSNKIAPR